MKLKKLFRQISYKDRRDQRVAAMAGKAALIASIARSRNVGAFSGYRWPLAVTLQPPSCDDVWPEDRA